MSDTDNRSAPGADGLHEFTMQVSGRELTCLVEKQGNTLKVNIDNNTTAELEVHWDGSIAQVSGTTLSESQIVFIKKCVLGHDK